MAILDCSNYGSLWNISCKQKRTPQLKRYLYEKCGSVGTQNATNVGTQNVTNVGTQNATNVGT